MHWSEHETPWRSPSLECALTEAVEGFGPQRNSILQDVRAAQTFFLQGLPQLGGDTLRRAFLGIEAAVNCLDLEALWDCCLAVPQLALTTGWTDMLAIFARYLHQYTHIKLLPTHPLTHVAASLHRLSARPTAQGRQQQLEAFVARAWKLWVDCATRVRGRHDDVTIHLKRGYVTLVDPHHAMAGDIIRDFGRAVHDSLARRGAPGTTGRILELENLLVRMFLPLFTAKTAQRAEGMLKGVAARIEGKGPGSDRGGSGQGLVEEEFIERHLLFSANFFMASIAEYSGEPDKAAWYRQRSLESPRDWFWVQTSSLVESRLRADGYGGPADAIREERNEVQLALPGIMKGVCVGAGESGHQQLEFTEGVWL
ncbi:hypothetical protein NEMBOFW57_001401 [Staphylotrichum longicolle]|uniref:Uncharacterized protein n=1 Tax=Staphylotrichum longicolle TaxID=669026 RepID=A0AAD4F5Z4_9PEZI|nr:hypothetical protein NEMBOFW57_001401 [Staphylotrichum longicolle]